jgi:S-adenosylmethionine synthetase
MNPQTLYAAEHVLPGHPDKLCDAIADSLVQQAAQKERRALCGIEVAVHRGEVYITGRIACRGAETIDAAATAAAVYASAGYSSTWQPAPGGITVRTCLCAGPLEKGEDSFRAYADDQSILTGYAIDLPGTNFLPPEHWISWRLARRLERLRSENPDLGLGPDGKCVTVYDASANRLAAFSCSLQQAIAAGEVALCRAVRLALEEELAALASEIPGFEPRVPDTLLINGAGNFAVGGPEGDNGLSGKKLVADAYGPRVPIGGGALSGKDFFKADRAGALLARRLAKAVVLSGAAPECRATLAIFPGDTQFRVLSLEAPGGVRLPASRWASLMDLSLAGCGEAWTRAADLVDVARHGHFTSPELPWERIRIH